MSVLTKIFGRVYIDRIKNEQIHIRYFHSLFFIKNKGLEISFYFYKKLFDIFRIYIVYSIKGDHHGLRFEFQLLWLEFEFNFYDYRHWNWKKDRYYLPGEEEQEYKDLGE